MQLTTDENERAAVAANNAPLALAWGRIVDLEQERLQLRDLLREGVDNAAQLRVAASRQAYGIKLSTESAERQIADADADAENWHWRAVKLLDDE